MERAPTAAYPSAMLRDDAATADLVERLSRFRQRLLDQGRCADAARVDLAIAEARGRADPDPGSGAFFPTV